MHIIERDISPLEEETERGITTRCLTLDYSVSKHKLIKISVILYTVRHYAIERIEFEKYFPLPSNIFEFTKCHVNITAMSLGKVESYNS